MHRLLPICLCLALLHVLPAAEPETRDPWQWPFAATSIWNMPIGSGAVYKPANFQAANHVGVDTQHILELSASDPLRQCFLSPGFGPGRDEGTESIDFWLRLPDSWLVPDAGSSPYGGTPNSNYALRRWGAEADLVHEGCMITRTTVGGPFFLPDYVRWPNNRKTQSITGDGLQGGGQGATGMSALGGTLRRGALTGTAPIRHAIKVNPWAARYCHYSTAVPGWKWPARSADSYAAGTYNRNADPDIVMGSLFAIPPGVTAQSLGLTTDPGRKLFAAMQDYGVYFTDDAAWDTWDLVVERYEADDFAQRYGFSMNSATWKAEVNKLMQALHVITNNTPNSIGGGGTPRRALAPPFTGSAVAPTISAQPQARTVTIGQTATFSVTASGTPTPTFQWRKNGTGISGATSASYATPATSLADHGASFSVVVTNSAGSVTSGNAILTVNGIAPTISAQPQARSVTVGQSATFSVTASGTPMPSFQWQKNGANIGGATSASYSTSATTLADHLATYRVVVSNSAGSVISTSATLSVIDPLALPEGWSTAVIGSASPAGNTSYNADTWTIRGAGADIWNKADAFRYAWQPINGDFDTVVRVTGLTNTNAWAKAGLMLRENTTAGSRHISCFVTPSNGTAMQWRASTGGSSSHLAGPKVVAPTWLKLTRRGNTVAALQSADGLTWRSIGSRSVAIPAQALIGLAVTSHNNGTLSTATYTDLDVRPAGNN